MGGRRWRSARAFTQRHRAGLAAADGPGPNQGPPPNQSADALAGASNSAASAKPRTPIRDIALFPEARIVPNDNIEILSICQRDVLEPGPQGDAQAALTQFPVQTLAVLIATRTGFCWATFCCTTLRWAAFWLTSF